MNREDPRYQQWLDQYIRALIEAKANGTPVFGVIPTAYQGKDVALYLSKDNPVFLGRFFSSGRGHESVGLAYLVKELGYTIGDVNAIPTVYLYDGERRIP